MSLSKCLLNKLKLVPIPDTISNLYSKVIDFMNRIISCLVFEISIPDIIGFKWEKVVFPAGAYFRMPWSQEYANKPHIDG